MMNLEEVNEYLSTFKQYFIFDDCIFEQPRKSFFEDPVYIIYNINSIYTDQLKNDKRNQLQFLTWIGEFLVKETNLLNQNRATTIKFFDHRLTQTLVHL